MPDLGFAQSQANHSLLTKGYADSFVVVLVYVNDITVASPNVSIASTVKASLSSKFKLKDLGHLKFFLGLEVACSKIGIMLYKGQ